MNDFMSAIYETLLLASQRRFSAQQKAGDNRQKTG